LPAFKIRKSIQSVRGFFSDREYYERLIKIGVPITLQQLIMSSLNMVGVIMIGQLGASAVASVGLANQIFFLLTLILFGITSGSAMFTAQLWGVRDIHNIRKVLGLALTLGLLVATFFLMIAEFFPAAALGVYSTDPAVIIYASSVFHLFSMPSRFVIPRCSVVRVMYKHRLSLQ
jgi:Na+-driven multidrug efflux pump